MNNPLGAVKKKHSVIQIVCFMAVMIISVHAVPAGAEIQVQTTLLDPLGSYGSAAVDINNAGQIVGYGYFPVPGTTQFKRDALFWENQVPTDLGPGAAYGINNAGQIVLSDSDHGYIVQGETRTDIGSLGGGMTTPSAINDLGQVVGISNLPSSLPHAFLWQNGKMIDLGALCEQCQSKATAINNAGQIVGWSQTDEGTRAFLWENGTMTNLGTLGGTYSEARGINDKGQVVGYSTNSLGMHHAFLWENGIMTDLDPLNPNYWTEANAINNYGQIVGSTAWAFGAIATIWQNGTTDFLLTGDFNYVSSEAFSINDNGQIVGDQARQQAVLWTVQSNLYQLKAIASLLAGSDIPAAISKNLQDKVNRTINFLNDGNNNAACGHLAGLINEVRGLSGEQIPQVQADRILSSAETVENALQCHP